MLEDANILEQSDHPINSSRADGVVLGNYLVVDLFAGCAVAI
jgi:hypothetical protein